MEEGPKQIGIGKILLIVFCLVAILLFLGSVVWEGLPGIGDLVNPTTTSECEN